MRPNDLRKLWPALCLMTALVACAGTSNGSSSQSTSNSGPDQIAITCTGPLAAPGATPAATNATGSCVSNLGSLVSHVSCADAARTGHLAGAETSELNVKTGSTSDNAVSVTTGGGPCSLTIPQNYVGLLQTTASVQDALVIVDFVPVSGENSTGIMLRCPQVGQFPCLALFMYSNESYQCVEAIGGNNNMLAEGSFAGQQFPAPELEISKPNRLVLSLKGNTIKGFINGRQICSGSTKVPVSSVPAVVQLAQAGGSVPARVDLLDIYVYAPA